MSADSSDSDVGASKSSSDEGSDSESESEEETPTPKAEAMGPDSTTFSSIPESRSPAGSSQTLPTTQPSDDSDSDSGSGHSTTSGDSSSGSGDSSDSDGGPSTGKKSAQGGGKQQKVKFTGMAGTVVPSQKSGGSSAVTKRRRIDEIGSSVVTSTVQQPKIRNPHQKEKGKGQPRKANAPFSRFKVDEVKFADERLRDNTFESRGARAGDYGAKANADLIVTRGAGFRKEKNKKKRGSYRGGEITVRQTAMRRHCITDTVPIQMESHSIKFTN